jgi:putative endonuclease
MAQDRRRHLGALGEDLAAEHLIRRGFQIIERNYRTRSGELDMVAFDGRTLVFCEVKTRRGLAVDRTPFESLHPRKRRQVREMARSWLANRPDRPLTTTLRFDAIAVWLDAADRPLRLEHLEGAF